MDAISEVVDQINTKIRSRKGILAPKITDLRTARSKHAEVCLIFRVLGGLLAPWYSSFVGWLVGCVYRVDY